MPAAPSVVDKVNAEEGSDAQHAPAVDTALGGLHRGLSARQTSMIAIAGTIGRLLMVDHMLQVF